MSNWPEWLPLRAELRPLTPYGAPQVDATARLNTNENPFGPSKELSAAISKRIGEVASSLNRYPDRDAKNLRGKIVDYLAKQCGARLEIESIWAANGSNEILQSIFLAFGSGQALGFTPSYSMHPLIGRVTGVDWIDGHRDSEFKLDINAAKAQILKLKPALTFVTTPNNPTGEAIKFEDLKILAATCIEVNGLLIVDEAYAEFSNEESAINLIPEFPNVLVSRTMSKAFAFAGVRLGYLAADKAVIDAIQLVRLPYHLSTITQAAAEVAFEFQSELLAEVKNLISAREQLSDDLRALGLKVIPSDANFILFGGFKQSSHELWQKLLAAGVLIRDVGLEGWLRVTIGNGAENELFLSSLKGAL